MFRNYKMRAGSPVDWTDGMSHPTKKWAKTGGLGLGANNGHLVSLPVESHIG